MPALSPERFLKLDIPIQPATNDASHCVPENCDCADSDFRVYPWPGRIGSQLRPVVNFLRSYRRRTVEVTPSSGTDSPESHRNWNMIQEHYLGPTLEVLNRDLFDPMLCLPPLRAYITDVEHGPMRIAMIAMNDPDDDAREWCGLKENFDAGNHKKCFGIAIFLRPGVIRAQDFPSPEPVDLNAPPIVHCAINAFLSRSQDVRCIYGMITDGITSVLLNEEGRDRSEFLPHQIIAEAVSTTKVSIRLTLAMFAYHAAGKSGLKGAPTMHVVSGTLPAPRIFGDEDVPALLARQHFCDFDLFTMQRSRDEWWLFCEWRRVSALLAKPLRCGDVLAVERNGFGRHFLPWRSPYPNQAVPPKTLQSVKQFFRPRDDSVDALLAASAELSFEISDVCRASRDTFSQVFLGHLTGSSRILCLKLFDERFFPIPDFAEVDFTTGEPCHRLLDLNFAEDMMRREEAVYDRLAYLQGYIIPHCYGFHVFTLPDGWEVLGLLMEAIDAPSLSRSGIPDLSREGQASFLMSLRHAVRALKFAGITQSDWHLDQVLCPRTSDAHDEIPGVVLIDFAFATQHLGDMSGTPVTLDFKWLRSYLVFDLGIDKSLMDECWFEAIEEEYC